MKRFTTLLLCLVMLCTVGFSSTVMAEGTDLESDTEATDNDAVKNGRTKPYDPSTDGYYDFGIEASYDTSKSYTAGDTLTLTFTLTTDAKTELDMSNAYLSVRGKQEYLTGAAVSKDKPYEKQVDLQIPWDQESDKWWVYFGVGIDGQESGLCSGDIDIPTVPVTPIIENGEYRFPNPDAPVRYLITFKLGNGVKSYGIIGGGGGDAREDYHPDTGVTDYYLRPGYMSSFMFDVEDQYAVKDEYGYVSGLKDGYELEIKLLEGDCDLTYYDYTPLMGHFDIKKPSVYVVSVVKKETTLADPSGSGVKVTLPEAEAADLSLKVEISNGEGEKAAVEKVVTIDGDKIRTYDLSMLKNGKPYTYDGQFVSTVALPVPEGWNMEQLALYYFNEKTSQVTPVAFTVDQKNSQVIFETNHFSKYVLVQKAKDPAGNAGSANDGQNITNVKSDPANTSKDQEVIESVKTGDTANIWLWSGAAVLALAGVAAAVQIKRKHAR